MRKAKKPSTRAGTDQCHMLPKGLPGYLRISLPRPIVGILRSQRGFSRGPGRLADLVLSRLRLPCPALPSLRAYLIHLILVQKCPERTSDKVKNHYLCQKDVNGSQNPMGHFNKGSRVAPTSRKCLSLLVGCPPSSHRHRQSSLLNLTYWTYLDAVVVFTGLFDYIVGMLGAANVRVLRLLRICRLLRLGRVFRALNLIWPIIGLQASPHPHRDW